MTALTRLACKVAFQAKSLRLVPRNNFHIACLMLKFEIV